MRAITVHPPHPNSIELRDVPEPPDHDGAVLVQALALGVCGTDREIIAGDYGEAPDGAGTADPRPRVARPRAAMRPTKSDLKPGDHVVGIVRHPDPVPCPACASGQWDMCRNGQYTEHGIKGLNGFGAERWRIDPEYAVKVDRRARARRRAAGAGERGRQGVGPCRIGCGGSPRRRRSACSITGAGPIGLLAALLGMQRGLDVHVYDHNKTGPKPAIAARARRDLSLRRRRAAREARARHHDRVHRRARRHRRAAAAGRARRRDLPHRRRRLAAHDFDIGLFNRNMVLNNGTVFGTVNANLRHYQMAADALARADRDWLARLITRRVPLARFAEAFERRKGDIKVVDRVRVRLIMPERQQPHRGLCADRRLRERRAGRARRLDRLAVLAALRFRCLFRGAARRTRSTAASASRRKARSRSITRRYRPDTLILETQLRDRRRRRDADRLHAGPRAQSGLRAHRRRRARARDDVRRAGAALRLRRRSFPGCASSATARCARSPAPTWWCCARRCTCAART